MKKTIFLQLFIFLLILTIILPNFGLAANLVTKKGIIIQKDEQSLVMESNQDLNFWQYLWRLFKYEKVKYIVFNKSLTEIKKTSGSVFSRKTETISFADLKVGDNITVKGELLKKVSKEENGEINANLITTVFLTRTTRGPIVINGTTITSSSVISLDNTDLTKENEEEVVVNPNLPWIKSYPVVTQPEEIVYKSKECASDGEPILQISALMGITADDVPTKCCEGLELCLLAKQDTNNIINFKGFSAIVRGYCKTSCPEQDNSDVLLPKLDATKNLWDKLIGLFKGNGFNECSRNEDCVTKYCLDNKFNCNYYCGINNQCAASDFLLKTKCEDDIECIPVNDGCALTNVIIAGNNGFCVCDNGTCRKNTSVSTTTRPDEVILTCEKNTECGWCNFNCLTQSEKNNLQNIGVTCNTTPKPGFKCSCENRDCMAIPDFTPTTIINPDLPIIVDPIVPTPEKPIVNPPSIIAPGQPIPPPVTLPTTTTTVGKCQGYYMNNDETGTWCDSCSSVKCGDGVCSCREKYPWEKYLGQSGGIQIALYAMQNDDYCASDCQVSGTPPITQNSPILIPPTTMNTITPITPPSTIVNPEYCTMDWVPVCGMDGIVYSNDCFAKNAGVQYCRFFTDLGNMICQCN